MMANLRVFAISLAVAPLLGGCWHEKEAEVKELSRTPSPDARVEAVLVARNFDATVPLVNELYIVQIGKALNNKNLILRADHVSVSKVSWRASKLLEFQYETARIFHFSNFWQSKDVDDFKYIIEIRLQPPPNHSSLQ